MPRSTLVILSLALLAACKPRQPCADPDAPVTVQVLASAEPTLNSDDAGAPWPTNLRVYELRPGVDIDRLDFTRLFHEGDKLLGDAFLKVHEYVVFPDRKTRWQFELHKETAQVLTVGLFQRPVGDAWYQVYNVPRDHAERRCEAEARDQSLPDPCIYLAFERSEISGGRFPPAGFDFKAFETTCAPVVSLAKKKKKKKKRNWRDPKIPKIPTIPSVPTLPQTPQAPTLPATPQAPALPQAPAAPQAPSAPQAPRGPAAPHTPQAPVAPRPAQK